MLNAAIPFSKNRKTGLEMQVLGGGGMPECLFFSNDLITMYRAAENHLATV